MEKNENQSKIYNTDIIDSRNHLENHITEIEKGLNESLKDLRYFISVFGKRCLRIASNG
jgi:hypothetical protein